MMEKKHLKVGKEGKRLGQVVQAFVWLCVVTVSRLHEIKLRLGKAETVP